MSYAERKEKARQEAIEWQVGFSEKNYSWDELLRAQTHFEKLGRKLGLLKEFRENGIC